MGKAKHMLLLLLQALIPIDSISKAGHGSWQMLCSADVAAVTQLDIMLCASGAQMFDCVLGSQPDFEGSI